MKRVWRKKELEIILEQIRKPCSFKAELEQYITPAHIASDILWTAFYNGDIEGKTVIDLGCGTGIFSIGSALLNARRVIGIDIDEELIGIAREEARKLNLHIQFIVGDVQSFNDEGDVVIMNPPFGAQYANRKADQLFLKKAMDISQTIYSLHIKRTLPFIKRIIEENGWRMEAMRDYRFPIKASHPFHEKKVVYMDVMMIIARSQAW